jgi:hypothetical protein
MISQETARKLLQALRRLKLMVEPLIEGFDIDAERTEMAVSVLSGGDDRPVGRLNLAAVLAEAGEAIAEAEG